MKSGSREISDLRLEQYALGELSAGEAREVQEALESDERARVRLEEIKRSDREIRDSFPPVRMAPLIEERLREAASSRRRPSFLNALVPLAAAALVTFTVLGVGGVFTPDTGAEQETTRVKGKTELFVYRKTADGAESLADGSAARRTDMLQIAYNAGLAKYGTIFSMDGRGVVTFHLPPDYSGGKQYSPELDQQGKTVLPSAYELDDAPSFERFFFVYSGSRFDLSEVQKAAASLSANPSAAMNGALRIPSGLSVYSIVLKKQG